MRALLLLFTKRQNIAAVFLLAAVLLAGNASAGAAAAGVRLVIDGQVIDALPAPKIVDGRALAPVRIVAETLGVEVQWDEQSRTVVMTRGEDRVRLRVDNRLVDLPGTQQERMLTDVPPRIFDGRTYVPLRLVATALGVAVRWEAATRTVVIDAKGAATPGPQPAVATIASLQPGQVITGAMDLQIATHADLPGVPAEVRFLLLDPETGRGPVVDRGTTLTGTFRLLPDPDYNGPRLLALAIYDQVGRFLAGDVLPVELAVEPQVEMIGLSPGQQVDGSVPLSTRTNFLAKYVEYQLIDPGSGEARVITQADPEGRYNWVPQPALNGDRVVRAVAYDRLGQAHTGQQVAVRIAVQRRVILKGVSGGMKVDKPVTLSLSVNFPVSGVRYVLRDPVTGNEETLAKADGVSSYRWLPVEGQAGKRELMGEVVDDQGSVYATDKVTLDISGNPALHLATVGPNQVLAGEVRLSILANVTLTAVEYQLVNSAKNEVRVIAGGTGAKTEYSWTPKPDDAGLWQLRAVGTVESGTKVTSQAVPVRVYVGQLFGPVPVIEKPLFMDFAAELARQSQSRTGMSAALQVAQAILESGWGQYGPVDKYAGQQSYNLFGIKGTGPAGSVISNTWEEYNGISFRVDASFRAYHNPAESWDDHKKLLLTAERYAQFRAVMHDAVRGAWALKRAGYATDSQYPMKLMDIIQRYDLDALDHTGV